MQWKTRPRVWPPRHTEGRMSELDCCQEANHSHDLQVLTQGELTSEPARPSLGVDDSVPIQTERSLRQGASL
jgi:hypothetical protein